MNEISQILKIKFEEHKKAVIYIKIHNYIYVERERAKLNSVEVTYNNRQRIITLKN